MKIEKQVQKIENLIQKLNVELITRTDLPYIRKYKISVTDKYNPFYGDDRMCKCGHPYYRHFDTYDEMYPCGCKYCGCGEFIEDVSERPTSRKGVGEG